MEWDETKTTILATCGSCLEPHGYRHVKSRDAFEKSSAVERRGVHLTLIASKHGNYSLRAWCALKNDVIEERFHATSGIDSKQRVNYTTINLGDNEKWYLNSTEQIATAVSCVSRFITDTALPFLEREYDVRDYSRRLNTNPEGASPYHGNRQNRCHYGLIAAKLAADPGYEKLKGIYTEFMRSNNKGFYFPRFAKLLPLSLRLRVSARPNRLPNDRPQHVGCNLTSQQDARPSGPPPNGPIT